MPADTRCDSNAYLTTRCPPRHRALARQKLLLDRAGFMQNPAQPGKDILKGRIIATQFGKNKGISHPFPVEKDVALAMKRYKRLNWPFKILDVLVRQILLLYRF